MSTNSFLVFAGIAPHPPIMVPEVGGDAIHEVLSSINGMTEFSRRVIASGAETVVLISPHAPLLEDSFVVYDGPAAAGSFARFRSPQTKIHLEVDDELLNHIVSTGSDENYQMTRITNIELDHGTSVPLYFLLQNGWHGQVVALGYSFFVE